MHQIKEMHTLLIAVIMTWKQKLFSQKLSSQITTLHFKKKIFIDHFHEEAQLQAQFVQLLKNKEGGA